MTVKEYFSMKFDQTQEEVNKCRCKVLVKYIKGFNINFQTGGFRLTLYCYCGNTKICKNLKLYLVIIFMLKLLLTQFQFSTIG